MYTPEKYVKGKNLLHVFFCKCKKKSIFSWHVSFKIYFQNTIFDITVPHWIFRKWWTPMLMQRYSFKNLALFI